MDLVAGIIKGMRRLASGLQEREAIRVDDLNLQHMLFYHNLVGTAPDNTRLIRDLRADILQAIKDRSAVQLAIGLKLDPLEWREQLRSIVENLDGPQRSILGRLLLPDDFAPSGTTNRSPLEFDDWRVRANACCILGELKETSVVPQMGHFLNDTTQGGKRAYMNVVLALAEMPSETCLDLLVQQIHNPEPWLRVDLANALAHFSFDDVSRILSLMLCEEREMVDYMSVAIARKLNPSLFLASGDADVRSGGYILIAGITEAANGSFGAGLIHDLKCASLVETISESAIESRSPFEMVTAIALIDWALHQKKEGDEQLPSENTLIAYLAALTSESARSTVLQCLQEAVTAPASELESFNLEEAATIKLVGLLDLKEAGAMLVPLLKKSLLERDLLVESLGAIGEPSSAKGLIELAKGLVDLEERDTLPRSKNPVSEKDPASAKTYWLVLKALGNLPCKESVDYLAQALGDFAPDKRAEALGSLIRLKANGFAFDLVPNFDEMLAQGLKDVAPMVKLKALEGVLCLRKANLVDLVVSQLDFHENSVSKTTVEVLEQLSVGADQTSVIDAIERKLARERDAFKRKRLQDLITRCSH